MCLIHKVKYETDFQYATNKALLISQKVPQNYKMLLDLVTIVSVWHQHCNVIDSGSC